MITIGGCEMPDEEIYIPVSRLQKLEDIWRNGERMYRKQIEEARQKGLPSDNTHGVASGVNNCCHDLNNLISAVKKGK